MHLGHGQAKPAFDSSSASKADICDFIGSWAVVILSIGF